MVSVLSLQTLLACHLVAFIAGFVLDLLIGDPSWFPHPVRAIGKLISVLEARLNLPSKSPKELRRAGTLLVVIVVLVTAIVVGCVLAVAYSLGIWIGIALEAALTCMVLSMHDLRKQSMKVYKCLVEGDLKGARHAVSMIVGRDTNVLDATGVAKAAIETVAENAADGVIAPMICAAIGGPVLGFIYKAINTMDSMVGYKNEQFLHFGRSAAKLDDIANFLPSRISAFLMMGASLLLSPIGGEEPSIEAAKVEYAKGESRAGSDLRAPRRSRSHSQNVPVKVFSASRAYSIFRRDRFKHKSPNSAQTESTCAGSLGIQLAGDISYFGVMHKKPTIGDNLRRVVPLDILRANQLMYGTALLCEAICVVGILIVSVSLGSSFSLLFC